MLAALLLLATVSASLSHVRSSIVLGWYRVGLVAAAAQAAGSR
jgi:hypothetical protein